MVVIVRPAGERGHQTMGEDVESFHSFDFAACRVGMRNWGCLRVLNEDVVGGGGGVADHPHRDAEIFTYLLEGALEHTDSLSNERTRFEFARASESKRSVPLQLISAGNGMRHAERNASGDERCRLIQVWLTPNDDGHAPSYQQVACDVVPNDDGSAACALLASRDGRDGSARARADASVYAVFLRAADGSGFGLQVGPGRIAYVHHCRGAAAELSTNGGATARLGAGDGVAVREESSLALRQAATRADDGECELLVFDMDDPDVTWANAPVEEKFEMFKKRSRINLRSGLVDL